MRSTLACLAAAALALAACDSRPASQFFSSLRALPAFAKGTLTLNAEALRSKLDPLGTEAWYGISIEGVRVGTAAIVARKPGSAPDPNQSAQQLELRFAHKVGASPVITTLLATLRDAPEPSVLAAVQSGHMGTQVATGQIKWGPKDGAFVLGEGDALLLQQVILRTADAFPARKETWREGSGLLLYRGRKDVPLFSPLTGRFEEADALSAEFDEDGFARKADAALSNRIRIRFERLKAAEYREWSESIALLPIDLAMLVPRAQLAGNLRELRQSAEACAAEAASLEREVSRTMASLPYLVHRKIVNHRSLCEGIAATLGRSPLEGSGVDRTLEELAGTMRAAVSGDRREIARQISLSGRLDEIAVALPPLLWPEMARSIVQQGAGELRDLLAIERTRKVAVTLRVKVSKLLPKAVLKGTLRSLRSGMRQSIAFSPDPEMRASSWKSMPVLGNLGLQTIRVASAAPVSNLKSEKAGAAVPVTSTLPFELLHGQAFATGEFRDLASLCRAFEGRIGLDLGDTGGGVVTGLDARGLWDVDQRILVAREFLRRVGTEKACVDVQLNAPTALTQALTTEAEAFQRDVLQTETEFQISNGLTRQIRLVPGTFQLVLSSLVTGAVITRQEIQVTETGRNQVTIQVP